MWVDGHVGGAGSPRIHECVHVGSGFLHTGSKSLPASGLSFPHLSYEQTVIMDCVCVLSRFSRVQLFAIPWTVPYQVPSSMEFSRQEY